MFKVKKDPSSNVGTAKANGIDDECLFDMGTEFAVTSSERKTIQIRQSSLNTLTKGI